MPKHTLPDANQADIAQALQYCGFTVFDMHNVPSATEDPALAGLPDLLAIDPQGLTLIGQFDRREVLAALQGIERLIIIEGATIQPEVKTPDGTLRAEQVVWWRKAGLKPLVFRTWAEVLEFAGRSAVTR